MSAPISPSSPAPPSALAGFFEKAGMLVVLAILFVGCSVFVENFFSFANMKGLALAVSMTGNCNYCRVKVTTGEFDWVLSRIEQDESYGG